jgi:hypothetical protein
MMGEWVVGIWDGRKIHEIWIWHGYLYVCMIGRSEMILLCVFVLVVVLRMNVCDGLFSFDCFDVK